LEIGELSESIIFGEDLKVENAQTESTAPGREFAGSRPLFPPLPGNSLAGSMALPSARNKHLIFNRLQHPGQIHVYSTECRAGERLRVQMLVPVLPLGGSVVPAFAVIAQSLPYSADLHKLPIELPAGYSAVVAPPPNQLVAPVQDKLTRTKYYPAPTIDTRTLVSGRCYVVVWSPRNQMGKYALLLGNRWPLSWAYWVQLPRFWWQIRGWFGLSRAAAYAGAAALLVAGAVAAARIRRE